MSGEHESKLPGAGGDQHLLSSVMLSGVTASRWGGVQIGARLLVSERFVPGSVEGPQGDELSAEMLVGELVPSRSRLGALSVLTWPLGQEDLTACPGFSWSP